jgi:regulator of sigma E protease
VGEVEAGSPAATAGLRPGDEIYAVSGETFEFFGERNLIDALRGNAGKTVTLDVVRDDGSRASLTATLRPAAELSETRGALGVSGLTQAYSGTYVGHDIGTALGLAATQVVEWGGFILGGLGTIVSGFISNPTGPPPVGTSGPIGIAVGLTDIFLGSGPILTLFFAGFLSVNLGVVNILPFPPLDGGRMAMLLIKRVFGTRVSLRAERITYAVGFVFLMVFITWVSGWDIIGLGQTP